MAASQDPGFAARHRETLLRIAIPILVIICLILL
jgi:hypothetical protein